jgi:hypothetical protein
MAFAVAYLGMLSLCLAMARHYRQLFSSELRPTRQRVLRALAVGLLTTSVLLNILAFGLSIGLVLCVVQLMSAGLLVGLVLAWREQALLPLGGILGLLGAVSAIAST